tara:strand:+ start:458 stop:805 length:348 start_codon:yes stop_codon:yes gene_type:complete
LFTLTIHIRRHGGGGGGGRRGDRRGDRRGGDDGGGDGRDGRREGGGGGCGGANICAVIRDGIVLVATQQLLYAKNVEKKEMWMMVCHFQNVQHVVTICLCSARKKALHPLSPLIG